MRNKRARLVLQETIRLLKNLRTEKEISHATLAAKAGISRPAISHIESGKRNPTLLMAIKLAQGLDTELSSLIREAERKAPGDQG